ncbi:MAG: prephenate dehydratase [Candidatus Omnitrophota bacterium]
MKQLQALRKKIDLLDKNIITNLNRRARLSLEIGEIKRKRNVSAYAPDREMDVYKRIAANSKGPLSKTTLESIYREVMSGTLSLEAPLKIAYLGPPATFTHLASLKKFGSSVQYVTTKSIADVFAEVESQRVDFGVVPIENSIEGAVNHTLDMFVESDLKICSEVSLEISHNLLAKKGTKLSRIKNVYSNPQVFGQCRIWLEGNLSNADLVEVASTTKSAEIVAKQKDSACIASVLAAGCYGLNILAKGIEDYAHNVTRFLVIGRVEPKPTRHDKTSILFSVKDKVGALHAMLAPFRKNGINLTKIESRPSKKKVWDYYFFVDLEGHHLDPKIKKALKGLQKQTKFMKVLGSYPC